MRPQPVSLVSDIQAAFSDEQTARALISGDPLGMPAREGRYGLLQRPSPDGGFRPGRRICRVCRRGTDTADSSCDYCGGPLEQHLAAPVNMRPQWQRAGRPRWASAWVYAVWALVFRDNGINHVELTRETGISRNGARHILRTLRSLPPIAEPLPLGGLVEVDEAIVESGGKQAIVALATELDRDRREITAVRIQRIRTVDHEVLTDFVRRHVAQRATVFTDRSPVYATLHEAGYRRATRTNSASVDPSVISMPGPRYLTTALKRWLLGQYHGAVRVQNLQPYLDEFCFRYGLHRRERYELPAKVLELLSALDDWLDIDRRYGQRG